MRVTTHRLIGLVVDQNDLGLNDSTAESGSSIQVLCDIRTSKEGAAQVLTLSMSTREAERLQSLLANALSTHSTREVAGGPEGVHPDTLLAARMRAAHSAEHPLAIHGAARDLGPDRCAICGTPRAQAR